MDNLQQIQTAIERFFYRVRINIALYKLLQSKEYSSFKKQVKLALENQILYFAKVEKVNEVIGVKKAVKELTEEDLLVTIALLFLVLNEFIEKEEFAAYLAFASRQGIASALNVLGVERELEPETVMGKKLSARAKKAMAQIDKTTMSWIARTIEQGLRDSESSYEIAKLIRDGAKNQVRIRSEMIAEQEAALMLGETQMAVYEEMDIEEKKWVTARDERVCEECVANETAGIISMNKPFPSGAMWTPQHIRCRCITLPVTKEPIPIEI